MRRQVLRRLILRVLDPRSKIDYVLLCLLAALPVGYAYWIGAHQNLEVGDSVYLGYWVKTNFWPMVFVLPLVLWIVRSLFNRIAPIYAPNLERVPPILKLIPSPEAQKQAYAEMRHYLSSPFFVATIFVLAIIRQTLDMTELMQVYFAGAPVRAGEMDWSVMYQAGVMTRMENFLLVVMAYTVQFVVIWFQCLLFVFLLAHNLFFLSRVYQRCRVPAGAENNFIQINLNDPDRCFGLRPANDAFNTQLLLLILFGVLALLSRFNNVYIEDAALSFDHFKVYPFVLPDINYFPDVGQVLISTFWLLTFFIVSMPALIKLLPWFSSSFKITEISVAEYLKEYVAPEHWPYEGEPSQRQIEIMAAKFSQNAFWPTGDNRASLFFFFCSWIFFIILLPIQTADNTLLVLVFTVLGVMAYVLRTLLFVLLKASLNFIDERLSQPRPELLAEQDGDQKVQIPGRVFISYRREDAAAYAKLIQQSLLPHSSNENLFMDRVAIHDGDDFVDKITGAVLECDALLVVIGPDWATCQTSDGQSRIKHEDDFVRLEVETGLNAGRAVIPVLVGGATMPTSDQVPESLHALLRRHARELSDSRWEYDTGELVKSLAEKTIGKV